MRTISLIALFLLCMLGCARQSDNRQASLILQLQNNAKAHGLLAQAVLVKHNNNLLFAHAMGYTDISRAKPVTKDSIFPIFSVSKLFASTLLFQLVEQNKINLEAPIGQYLEHLPKIWQPIPVAHFLNHSTGLPEYFEFDDKQVIAPKSIDAVIQSLSNTPLQFKPNSAISYNQTNYLVIKLLLEKITEQPYSTLVQTRILTPLKMHKTFIKEVSNSFQHVTAYLPNSGDALQLNPYVFPSYANIHSDAYSNIHDLGIFLSALINGELVDKSLLESLWQPALLEDGSKNYFASSWEYEEVGNWHAVGHDGGGVLRVKLLFKENMTDSIIVIYLTNGNLDGVWSRALINSIESKVLPDRYSRLSSWFDSLFD
ncbi:serine hydrolase domain-containing protein [Pseudoalteromonas xiamenensis]